MAAKQFNIYESGHGFRYYAPDDKTMANYLNTITFKQNGTILIHDDMAVIPLRRNVYQGDPVKVDNPDI